MDAAFLFNSSAERYADVGYTTHWVAIAVTATVTFVGVVVTLVVGLALYKDPVIYRSFAYLCLWQAVCDECVLCSHFFVAIPAFAVREPLSDLRPSISCAFNGTMFFAGLGLIALITFNRYLGITRPATYNRLFSESGCKKWVFLCFVYGGTCGAYMSQCPCWFDVQHYLIAYDRSRPCGNVVNAIVICQAVPVMLFGVACTFLSIRAIRKQDFAVLSLGGEQRRARKEKSKRQKNILMQSACNCLFQVAIVSLFNIVSPVLAYFDFRITVLFANTLAWSLAHMFNSFVLLLFNQSIQNYILCRKKINGNQKGASTRSTTAVKPA